MKANTFGNNNSMVALAAVYSAIKWWNNGEVPEQFTYVRVTYGYTL
jgi:hypothetical protein